MLGQFYLLSATICKKEHFFRHFLFCFYAPCIYSLSGLCYSPRKKIAWSNIFFMILIHETIISFGVTVHMKICRRRQYKKIHIKTKNCSKLRHTGMMRNRKEAAGGAECYVNVRIVWIRVWVRVWVQRSRDLVLNSCSGEGRWGGGWRKRWRGQREGSEGKGGRRSGKEERERLSVSKSSVNVWVD